jgi:hypothetical protein
MCLNPSRDTKHYWGSKNPMFGNLWIRSKMSRERWQYIQANLHFDILWMIKHHEQQFEVC